MLICKVEKGKVKYCILYSLYLFQVQHRCFVVLFIATVAATKSLYTVIRETYEAEWVDLHSVDSAIRVCFFCQLAYSPSISMLTMDFHSLI